ncbi:MAG: hypothetical protein IJY79_06330 [Clostridia bacterium]|nr:hypothetical protein [Clostridia bacterium]
MKNFLRSIGFILAMVLAVCLCGCSKPSGDMSSGATDTMNDETAIIQSGDNTESVISGSTSSNNNSTDNDSSSGNNDQQQNNTSSHGDNDSTSSTPSEAVNPNASAAPDITLCAQVASNIYIVGGTCASDTEYISISGIGVKANKITPTKAQSNSYFIAQVQIDYNTTIEIQGKETGRDLSAKVKKFITTNIGMKNLMTNTDYQPVFGLDNRMHFYSAILSYTLSDKVNSYIKEEAKYYMGETVNAAKSVGAEVIYLVVPSSVAVYPETLPSEYKAASGETIYEAFSSIAKQQGATVIYPLDTMKAHKNDGNGYEIYSRTDSHWTTYGAFFGVNELMSHISKTVPSAKPRTVQEMGFYTTELYAGDALFSFGDNTGFENYSQATSNGGATKITGIKELTTLYTLKMPTDTLSKITRNKKSLYLTKDIEKADTFTNANDSGLPTAVVVRDSFGRTAYDMINDRFSKVWWMQENSFKYENVTTEVYQNKPDYVIYIISERNLHKIMMDREISMKDLFGQ